MLDTKTLLRIASRVARRNKGLFKELRRKYKNVPDYVLKEMYSGDTDKLARADQYDQILKTYDTMDWKLETLDLHWSKLNGITKNNFRRRKFGIENPDEVPNDAERLARQVSSLAGDGENEPMIFLETEGGLELIEGFHRTMALLMKGAEDLEDTLKKLAEADDKEIDKIASSWKAVKAKAWVGSGGEEEPEMDFGEGDFF